MLINVWEYAQEYLNIITDDLSVMIDKSSVQMFNFRKS